MLEFFVYFWSLFSQSPEFDVNDELKKLSPHVSYEYEYGQVVCEQSWVTIVLWKQSPFNTLEPYVTERFWSVSSNNSDLMIFDKEKEFYFWDEHVWFNDDGRYIKTGAHRFIKVKNDIEFYMMTPDWSPPKPSVNIQKGFPEIREMSQETKAKFHEFWLKLALRGILDEDL